MVRETVEQMKTWGGEVESELWAARGDLIERQSSVTGEKDSEKKSAGGMKREGP